MQRWALLIVFVAVILPHTEAHGKVLELSERFLPLRKEGMWLVKFYAPWCGHCKKLEPIWKHVAQSLVSHPVRVGRVDCTKFTKVAQEFDIRGFPTIMFLKGDNVYTYEGDRTREDIVAFTSRMMGPPVRQIDSSQSLHDAKKRSQLFFLYIGDTQGDTWNQYQLVAGHFQKDEFMYRAEPTLMRNYINSVQEAGIYVYKDSQYYQYSPNQSTDRLQKQRNSRSADDVTLASRSSSLEPTLPTTVTNLSLYTWVTVERFPLFLKVTRAKLNNVLATKKLLVMAVLEENKIDEITPEMEDFKDMLRRLIENNREKYHDKFQFGWTGSPDLANSIAMQTLSLPNLLVINSSSYQHHLPQDHPTQLTAQAIQIFLDSILAGEAPTYGGSSWTVRLYRAYYETSSALYNMWRGNPVLTSVLLGLPMGFLSLIFYSICCADIMDADEEEQEEDWHDKND